jgi:hypothetical protein
MQLEHISWSRVERVEQRVLRELDHLGLDGWWDGDGVALRDVEGFFDAHITGELCGIDPWRDEGWVEWSIALAQVWLTLSDIAESVHFVRDRYNRTVAWIYKQVQLMSRRG